MGVTLLLSFSIFILMINDEIPRTSDEIPIIMIYIILVIGISALSIAETVFVLKIYHTSGSKKPPKWLHTFMCNVSVCNHNQKQDAIKEEKHFTQKTVSGLVDALCLSLEKNKIGKMNDMAKSHTPEHIQTISSNGHIKEQTEHGEMTGGYTDNEYQWKEIAEAIDRFSFWFLLALFLLVVLSLIVVMPRLQEPKEFTDAALWM